MFQFFANIFGYLLNIINNFVGNYGLAIILFTLIIKLIMLIYSNWILEIKLNTRNISLLRE